MQVGIIGAGAIGSILARRLVDHGHQVLLANSRGPDSLAALAQRLGAMAVTVGDAARAADLVIVSIPEKSILDLPPGLFEGVGPEVPVIDTGNYYPFRDGVMEALEHGEPESRWVATQLGRPVVKVFNNIMAPSLAAKGKEKGAAGRVALPIAGDDAAAKAKAAVVVELMGFDAVDAGTIEESWRQQPGSPVYCTDWDAAGVRAALSAAERSRLAELRDLMIEKVFAMPADATLEERVEAARGIFS
jgi:predicted dinucleotide-binding enzyme